MTTSGRRWPIFLLILGVALLLRGTAAVWWQSRLPVGQPFVFGDSESYWQLAGRLARGQSYQFGADTRIFRTPGYPVVLSLLFRLWGGAEPPVLAARFWGAIWGVGAVAATMALARVLLSERAAMVAGAIAAVHPEAIASSVFVLSEATFGLPMLLQLAAWAAAWRARDAGRSGRVVAGWAFAAGVMAGIATLMRPGWLLFVPWALFVLSAWHLVRRDGKWREELRIGVVMAAGLVCTMTPWWWRNYQVTGRFVATTLQVGASLYDGVSPDAQGGSDMEFVPAFIAAQRQADEELLTPPVDTFEERLDRRLRDASIEWAKAHPGRVASLAAVKLGRLWNVWPNSSEMGGWPTRLILAIAYLPLVVCAGLGEWHGIPKQPLLIFCLLPAGYLTCLHIVFVSSIRYRQPAIFVFAVLAAAALSAWAERRAA